MTAHTSLTENDQQNFRGIHAPREDRGTLRQYPEFWLILITQTSQGRVEVEPDLRSAYVSAEWNTFTLQFTRRLVLPRMVDVSSFYIVTRGLQRYLRRECKPQRPSLSFPSHSHRTMVPLFHHLVTALVAFLLGPAIANSWCRNQPGDPGYPSAADWSALNDTVDGRLVRAVPSAEACQQLSCTEAQWKSGIFRQKIPGSMNAVGISTWSFSPLVTLLCP